MSLLIVGSLAFDDIETAHGSVADVMGGSASFSTYVASFYTKPRLIAALGEDFPPPFLKLLTDRGVDAAGVVKMAGEKTFRWKGRYHADMNGRDTIEVHLNVLAKFDPHVPESFRDSTHVFLANAAPSIQMKVLEQVTKPRLVIADTMDLWIEHHNADLKALLRRVDGLLLNDSEARMLTGKHNLIAAGKAVLELGPKFVVLKKGEHGAMLFTADGLGIMPAFPTHEVIDPTGAGDTFAGGFLGYVTQQGKLDPPTLKRGLATGAVLASFTVEDFGLERLKRLTQAEIDERLALYQRMIHWE